MLVTIGSHRDADHDVDIAVAVFTSKKEAIASRHGQTNKKTKKNALNISLIKKKKKTPNSKSALLLTLKQ